MLMLAITPEHRFDRHVTSVVLLGAVRR